MKTKYVPAVLTLLFFVGFVFFVLNETAQAEEAMPEVTLTLPEN